MSKINPTDKDRELLMYLYRYRALKAQDHLCKLLGTEQYTIRRLKRLFEAGYVDRFERADRYQQYVYALGNAGANELASYFGIERKKVNWKHKNRMFSDTPHALLISDVMVGIELAVRNRENVSFISEEEIVKDAPEITQTRYRKARRDKRFEVIAPIRPPNMPNFEAHVYPDNIFGLRIEKAGRVERRYFILEADRGTMPLTTPDYKRASIIKKLYAYRRAGLRFGDNKTVFEELYAIPNFTVLFAIVPSKGSPGTKRATDCIDLVKKMTEGQGSRQFLFADRNWLANSDLLCAQILDGTGSSVYLSGHPL